MKTFITHLYCLNILILTLWGAHAWFLWSLDDPEDLSTTYVYSLISSIITIGYNSIVAKNKVFTGLSCGLIILLVLGKYFHTIRAVFVIIMMIVQYVPLIILFYDKNNALQTLKYITNGIAIILVPGICLHIYNIFWGLPISSPIAHPFSENYLFFNYLFLLTEVVAKDDVLRFQSVFLEPGFLGTLCVYLLVALKFNFRKWATWIIFISVILSLSLAGYITCVIAYWANQYSKGVSVKKYVLSCMLLVPVYFGAKFYNDGNNYLQERIFSRLELDDEKGLKGNNRFSITTDYFFDNMIQNGEIFWGLGPARVSKINGDSTIASGFDDQINGNGYKVFFITYGVWGAIMIYILYCILGPLQFKRGNRRFAWCILILYVITFMQASAALSWSWLIPYVLAMNCHWMDLYSKKNNC